MIVSMENEVVIREECGFTFLGRSADSIPHRVVEPGTRSLSLGQFVTVDRTVHEYATAGTRGVVVGIHFPYKNGRTSDIIDVWLEHHSGPIQMKMKELS